MIRLFQFTPSWGIPNASIFCVKLETYLRMTKTPFETVHANDPSKAPKGKLPYIQDGDKIMGDSTLIIEHLKKEYGDLLDSDLTSEQQGISIAVQRLLEDHLYWIILHSRWCDETGWPIIKETFFGVLPEEQREQISKQAREKMRREIYEQGLGHHTEEEMYRLGKEDIDALAVLLTDKNYLLGERPHSIDACVYGTLVNLLFVPFDSTLYQHAKTYPMFFAYCERMRDFLENIKEA